MAAAEASEAPDFAESFMCVSYSMNTDTFENATVCPGFIATFEESYGRNRRNVSVKQRDQENFISPPGQSAYLLLDLKQECCSLARSE